MNMKLYICVLLSVAILITGCNQLETTQRGAGQFQPKYPDMPQLPTPAKTLAGVYEGSAGMRMDESRPLKDYPGSFTVVMVDKDTVMLEASIKPGQMPFPVNYTLEQPVRLQHTKIGYLVQGNIKVDVTLKDGKRDMPEFYFTLNDRSRIFVDKDGSYWLELYYPDNKMTNGTILPGSRFFKGKKKT